MAEPSVADLASPDWPTQVRWVYVLCHSQYERARFERLVPHLLLRGIPKDRLKFCAPTWGSTLTPETIFKVYDPFLPRANLPTFTFKAARLSKGEVSLILNFFTAIQTAEKDLQDDECILVLESDVWLRRDFSPRLADAMRDVSGQPWDYISLSEGVGTRPPGAPASYYAPTRTYPAPHSFPFRCTDSMVLGARFVRNLCKTLLPFKEAMDWELNFQLALHKGVARWADPPLVEQGTCYSREESSLQ